MSPSPIHTIVGGHSGFIADPVGVGPCVGAAEQIRVTMTSLESVGRILPNNVWLYYDDKLEN